MKTTVFSALVAAGLIDHTVAGNYSGPLYGDYLGLFTANSTFSPASVIGDLTEPTYTGYARVACEPWVGPLYPAGVAVPTVVSANALFQVSGGSVFQTIIGWFLADAITAGNLHVLNLFPVPIPFTQILAGILMQVAYGDDPTVDPTAATVIIAPP
jgi:hypothetical protein